MYCNKCGNELKDGSKFCPACGAVVNGAGQAVPQAVAEPPKRFNQKRSGGKKIVLVCLVLVILAAAVFFLLQNANDPEKLIIGAWYPEDDRDNRIVFYDNYTVATPGGESNWSIVEDNILLLIDKWGDREELTVKSITGDRMVLEYDNGNQFTFIKLKE